MSRVFETTCLDPGRIVEMLTHGDLVAAGSPGGPPWTVQQRALLLQSLESGWPLGQLLVWIPTTSYRRWYLLDGHRRVDALMSLAPTSHGGDLVRDLTVDHPTYRPASVRTDGWYLPTTAMLATLPFLAATRNLPRPAVLRGERAASTVLRAGVDVVVLRGGTATTITELCGRLVPGRVDATVLDTITRHPHTGSSTPDPGRPTGPTGTPEHP